MKKIVHIVGNRPQFVKLAVLYPALHAAGFDQSIVHSGQHYDHNMSGIFFEQLGIPPPELFFKPTHRGANLFIGELADNLHHYFQEQKNIAAFVYGDTNTTFGAALAAKRTNTELMHFEAGIRTGDATMPEEINRQFADRMADVNFCCTERNYAQMIAEGYGTVIPSEVALTGDLMYDQFLKTNTSEPFIASKPYVAFTLHRAANLGSAARLKKIINEMNRLHSNIEVYMSLHPNTANKFRDWDLRPEFHLLDPMPYEKMKRFLMDAAYVVTDSGGAAREAFFAVKRSLVIMDDPFWPEIIENGSAKSVRILEQNIPEVFDTLENLPGNFDQKIFGDGKAAQKIAVHLARRYS